MDVKLPETQSTSSDDPWTWPQSRPPPLKEVQPEAEACASMGWNVMLAVRVARVSRVLETIFFMSYLSRCMRTIKF
jgi:hypothetical protein